MVHQMVLGGQAGSHFRVVALSCLFALIASGSPAMAAQWEETRTRFVDPLNSMLHDHWPTEIKNRNLDVLMQFYAVEEGTGITWASPRPVALSSTETTLRWETRGKEGIRDRYQRLLDLFGKFEYAQLRILRVDWRNPGPLGYRVTVHAVVGGFDPEGGRIQLEQYATLNVRFFDPFWEITSEEVTRRSLVTLDRPRFDSVGAQAGVEYDHQNELSPPF